MDKNKLWKWLLLGFLVLWSITLVSPPFDKFNEEGVRVQKGKIKLGLDLQGGSSFVVEVDADDVAKKMMEADDKILSVEEIGSGDLKNKIKEVQEIAVEVIRGRIDVIGTTEPEIYPEGDNRIVVRIPGADAETRAEARTQMLLDAVLIFKLVHTENETWLAELMDENKIPEAFKYGGKDGNGVFFLRDKSVPDARINRDYFEKLKDFGNKRAADYMLMEDRLKDGSKVYRPVFVETRTRLDGDVVKDANAFRDPMTSEIKINLDLNAAGSKKFDKVANEFGSQNANDPGRRLAIILDDKLRSAPTLRERNYHGTAVISGSFTFEEARTQVNVLRAGSLPGRVVIVEERTVAPTLGADSISSGLTALIYGGLSVLVFMLLYYRLPGLVANLSLLFVLLLLPVGMMLSSGFLSLSSAAISLPTLTLYGIAGIVLTIGMAVDANVLTFERMREEWKVGKSVSGSINAGYNKAFSTILDANVTTLLTAVILFWQGSGPIRGFAVTLSAGILVSMFIVLVMTRLFFNTLADYKLIKSIKMGSIPFLQNANFNFLGQRKYAAVISILVILGTWGYFAKKGEANFGVDFAGGTVTTFKFEQEQDIGEIREAVKAAGVSGAVLTPMTEKNVPYLDLKLKALEGQETLAQEAVLALAGNPEIVKTDSVGSQIGEELQSKGIKAIIFALIGIIIYISVRFEFSFAMGAITALVHDVLITIGIYCAMGYELSMPIIAALLTIVGYSVNDTIVVFDRIREDLKIEKGKSYEGIANLSINQTLSRTVLTSFTTLLTVVMLLVFGGGAVKDFALALCIGILVGTYSSIFVATPVVLFWHKEEKVK